MARPKTTFRDLSGRQFGRYTVLRYARSGHRGIALWLCCCDPERGGCGVEEEVRSDLLRAGKATQCRSCSQTTSETNTAKNQAQGQTLTEPIWPGACRACQTPFVGTARQKYCRPECRPSHQSRKGD